MADLQKTGVEAVVEGLAAFKSDVDDMNSKIGEIGSKGNIITRTLGGAWEMLQNLGQSAIHVAEYALGTLLADGIEFVVGKLQEMVSATIEAGAQFQIMELRLDRLNFNAAMESGFGYADAMEEATFATQEQLEWVQKLAVTTPYDAQDIANVFTLAQSYGFAADEAKGLTRDITDFAAGMGLGNTEIDRIIVNFGQMVQQGKVTQREMNDLARGAFVPVNDVLERMQQNVGLTDGAFEDFRQTGEGVQAFMTAFSQVVEERFSGAAQTMSQTFQGATANAQDFVKSLIGFGVVRPVLGAIGESISGVISALTQPERWDAMTAAAGRVGKELSTIVRLFQHAMGLNAAGIADSLVSGLQRLADWLSSHRDEIYKFFVDMKAKITDVWTALKSGNFGGFLKALGLDDSTISKILKFKDGILEVFNTISEWVSTNGPLISQFFGTLGEIIGGVFKNLTGGVDVGGGVEGLLGGVSSFMQFVIDHQEGITNFVTLMIQLWGILQLVGFAFSLIIGPVVAFVGFLISLAAIIGVIIAAVTFLLSPIGLLTLAIVALIAAWQYWGEDAVRLIEYVKFSLFTFLTEAGTSFGLWVASVVAWFQTLGANITTFLTDLGTSFGLWFASMLQGISSFITGAIGYFQTLWSEFTGLINRIVSKVSSVNWVGIGSSIIKGMIQGVVSAAAGLVQAVGNAVSGAVHAAQSALQAHSPSRVFIKLGEDTMEGMAIGIRRMAILAQTNMTDAMAHVSMPAITMSNAAVQAANVNNTSNSNYNLTINNPRNTENIIQDYGMLQSFLGV